MAEDIVLDAMLSSTGAGRVADIALFYVGNNLAMGTVSAMLCTTLVGGLYMTQHRKEGHGGGDATTVYICAAIGFLLCGIYWLFMVLLAFGTVTKFVNRVTNIFVGHVPLVEGFMKGHVSGAAANSTFSETEAANMATNIFGVLIGIVCIIAGGAVAALKDSQQEEYKRRATAWEEFAVATLFTGLAWGALQIVIVMF